MSFCLLWSKTLQSSLWINGTKEDKLLWFTILMMKDKDGMVLCSLIGLADAAKLKKSECEESLAKFMDPDADDTSGVNEGRRLRKVQGGWQVVNHEHYRFSTEAKREFERLKKQEQRAAEKLAAHEEAPNETVSVQKNRPEVEGIWAGGSEPRRLEMCRWFKRRPDTDWNKKERATFLSVVPKTPDDEFNILSKRYQSGNAYLRKDIQTLLNNWAGEIDRARGSETNGHQAKDESDPLGMKGYRFE